MGITVPSILIIHGFLSYEFAHLLKFICIPQILTHSTFAVMQGLRQSSEKFESPDAHILE